MKRYKKIFKEMSLNLTDKSLVDKIYQYFYEHPFPQDHEGIHIFADSIGIESDIVEEYIYAMLSVFICGGKAYDVQKTEKDFDEKEVAMGKEIEKEHLKFNTDNEVIKHIVELFSSRISFDHLTEFKDYYTRLKVMEDQAKK